MAASYPIPLADFLDGLRIRSVTFDLADKRGTTGLGSGLIQTYEIAPRLWTGTVTLALGRTQTVRQAAAQVRRLQGVGATFLVSDQSALAPYADPDGTTLGASTPTVHTLDSNNRDMRVQGLPSGYVLQRGDLLTIDQSNHLALHEIVTDTVTADGSGITPTFEVVPHIRPGAAVSDSVYLAPAYCKAMIVPGSVQSTTHMPGKISDSIQFDFVQVLR